MTRRGLFRFASAIPAAALALTATSSTCAPKTPAEAVAAGWKPWSPPGSKQTKFPMYGSNGRISQSAFMSFTRGDMHVNFEVPA